MINMITNDNFGINPSSLQISADPVVPGGARQRSYANCDFLGGVAVRSRVVRRCGSGYIG